jgi:hypothetical protein
MGLRALILVLFTDIAGIYEGIFLIQRKKMFLIVLVGCEMEWETYTFISPIFMKTTLNKPVIPDDKS